MKVREKLLFIKTVDKILLVWLVAVSLLAGTYIYELYFMIAKGVSIR